jgi:hypothetical protein
MSIFNDLKKEEIKEIKKTSKFNKLKLFLIKKALYLCVKLLAQSIIVALIIKYILPFKF